MGYTYHINWFSRRISEPSINSIMTISHLPLTSLLGSHWISRYPAIFAHLETRSLVKLPCKAAQYKELIFSASWGEKQLASRKRFNTRPPEQWKKNWLVWGHGRHGTISISFLCRMFNDSMTKTSRNCKFLATSQDGTFRCFGPAEWSMTGEVPCCLWLWWPPKS